ncbi:unnamed protein product [Vitrella brassicaformis CCMP3155]|uniref:VWFA domain-containing protein n=1 Tax=Vitrella brassicaformis (strain CCMP3155) TaxID=1169540 RepID=A0A0G4H4N7_VITBC|nr:unnamed protein product [Vitrella brassicaformis CCMP3155]|mmetsp:Transcript_1987/g.4376  ORF Transcript_1987/g.4376 Transcript_1987/m.4376 type:complete len:356 (-) Transcript_1987:496-1563(-)|eukprot:CEM38746.1 unnamed protein product [Vitrella brassicaformis CCMP3155]
MGCGPSSSRAQVSALPPAAPPGDPITKYVQLEVDDKTSPVHQINCHTNMTMEEFNHAVNVASGATTRQEGLLGEHVKWLKTSGGTVGGLLYGRGDTQENLIVIVIQTQSQNESDARTAASTRSAQMCHLCLDDSGSMRGSRLQKGKSALKALQPRLDVTPTNVHLIGGTSNSRLIYRHTDKLTARGLDKAWTANGGATYLWEYVYKSTMDYKDQEHDLIIITDGEDNHSPAPFRGLTGFNELMTRMKGNIRVSLLLIGSGLSGSQAKVYHHLCLATGGVYHHQPDNDNDFSLVMQQFVTPLLLTQAERETVAFEQRCEYENLVAKGEATQFDWYKPIDNKPAADAADKPVADAST